MNGHGILNFKISTNLPDGKAVWLSFGKARSISEMDEQKKDELTQSCVDTVRDCLKSFKITDTNFDFKVEYSDKYIGLGSCRNFDTLLSVDWLDTTWPMEREDIEFFRDVFFPHSHRIS